MNWTFFFQVVGLIALVVSAVVYVAVSGRRAYVDVLQKTSEGWKALAQQKDAEVAAIGAQLQSLREELQRVKHNYDELSQLYIKSQSEKAHLAARVTMLEKELEDRPRTAGRRRNDAAATTRYAPVSNDPAE